MRVHRTLKILAIAALAFPAAAVAQANNCSSWIKPAPVGSWAQYHAGERDFKLAIVGKEERAGKTLYRFEMTGAGPDGKPGIFQMLVPAFPYQPGDVEEIVMKMEGQPAMKMSGQMLGMMRNNVQQNPELDIAKQCAEMADLGEESVTVPAGTFKTHHFKNTKTGDEMWGSHDVPFVMVKYMGKKGPVTLTATGTDAKSAITEKPVEMQGMGHN
jgi:hypothetical protein